MVNLEQLIVLGYNDTTRIFIITCQPGFRSITWVWTEVTECWKMLPVAERLAQCGSSSSLSCGTWCLVAWEKFTKLSKEKNCLNPLVFSYPDESCSRSLQKSVNFYESTRRHVPVDITQQAPRAALTRSNYTLKCKRKGCTKDCREIYVTSEEVPFLLQSGI